MDLAKLHTIDPLLDRRWDDLVARHPRATAFHQRGWLEALARTYRYKPFVLTTTPAGKALSDGIVVCRIASWITGTRLVSLPFTDHCDPLFAEGDEPSEFVSGLRTECDRRQCRYVEFRPLFACRDMGYGLKPERGYCFHELDLTPTLDQIYRRMHQNSFRRNIRKAEKERLTYEVGNSERLVDEFYRLLIIARKRHQVLPQPRAWFRNLVECIGDKVQIRLARKNGSAIAAMLSLRQGSCVVFKYGGSDPRFHSLGGVPFLFWKLIEESKTSGAQKIDLGRSDWSNKGLIAFKDRIGATRRLLTYYRYTNREAGAMEGALGVMADWKSIFKLPDVVLSTAGLVMYRHMG